MRNRLGITHTLSVSAQALLLGLGLNASGVQAQASPDTFRMIVGEPRFMDPNLAADFSIFVNAQLFEPLARIDASGELVMRQALNIELGADGRTWTITLDPENKWSDGSPVTAADWEYSWKRILNPETASGVAFFLTDIKNAVAYNSGDLTDADTVGITATDEFTLQIVTEDVAPQFRAKLGLPYLTPVPKAVVEKVGSAWIAPENILSNGPYMLVSRINDQSIEMTANPHYAGTPPAIENIEMTIASGDVCAAQLRAYEAGEVDFATCLPSQDIPRVMGDPDLSVQLSPFEIAGTSWVQYDLSHAPWDNVMVRQAFGLAIDRQAIVTAVSDNTAHVATTIVPASIPGGNPADALTGTVEDAQRLLAEAGFPGGEGFPPFTLTVTSSSPYPLTAQILQQMWSQNLGVEMNINVLEENAYRAWVQARKTEPYDVMLQGWWSDYADPANWYGDLITNDYRNNHFANAEFADFVSQANAETDPAKRIALFGQANKILEQQQPMTALYNPTAMWLIKPYVRGLTHEGVLDFYHIGEATYE